MMNVQCSTSVPLNAVMMIQCFDECTIYVFVCVCVCVLCSIGDVEDARF